MRIAALRDDAKHRVALGEDADQRTLLDDQDRADAVLEHQPRGFEDGDLRGGRDHLLAVQQAPDPLTQHDSS